MVALPIFPCHGISYGNYWHVYFWSLYRHNILLLFRHDGQYQHKMLMYLNQILHSFFCWALPVSAFEGVPFHSDTIQNNNCWYVNRMGNSLRFPQNPLGFVPTTRESSHRPNLLVNRSFLTIFEGSYIFKLKWTVQ